MGDLFPIMRRLTPAPDETDPNTVRISDALKAEIVRAVCILDEFKAFHPFAFECASECKP